jgi:hypothetical protein
VTEVSLLERPVAGSVRARVTEETPADDPKRNPFLEGVLDLRTDHPFPAARGTAPEVAKRYELGLCAFGPTRGRIPLRLFDRAGDPIGRVGREAAMPSGSAAIR